MAIIDYLQEYNLRKRFEFNWKVHVLQYGRDIISSVDAVSYAKRFFNFMREEVIIDDKDINANNNRLSLNSSRCSSSSIQFVRMNSRNLPDSKL